MTQETHCIMYMHITTTKEKSTYMLLYKYHKSRTMR